LPALADSNPPAVSDREMLNNVSITVTLVLIEHDRKTVISN
jgi:hypothetical protein